jgi:hypothetical protein
VSPRALAELEHISPALVEGFPLSGQDLTGRWAGHQLPGARAPNHPTATARTEANGTALACGCLTRLHLAMGKSRGLAGPRRWGYL